MATKPVLVYLLKMRLEQDSNPSPTDVQTFASSQPIGGIVSTCVNAASLGLSIVSALHEQGLLGAYMFVYCPDLGLSD
jgi:hypothetical protein